MRWLFTYLLMIHCAVCSADEPTALDMAADAFKRKEYDQALKYADKAVAEGKNKAKSHFLRGLIEMELRQFANAASDFTKTLESNPRAAEALDMRGTAHFKMGKIKESLADFDKFIDVKPAAGAGHWRRGLTLYYADEFAKGVTQFTTSDREAPNDVENGIWHFLCNARAKGVDKARGEMLKVESDPRGPYFMRIYDLFAGKAKPDEVLAAAEAGTVNADLRKVQRFYANYYVGMYYESIGEAKKSLESLKTAVEKYPIGHYMMDVARVHIKLRDKN